MGYVDKQVAAYRKVIGDAVAGKGLRAAIRALQEKSQVKDSLAEARIRGAIEAKRKLAKRTGEAGGDYTELSRSFYSTLYTIYDTSGVFQIRYYNVERIVFDRGTFTFLDYDPSSP